MLSTTASGSSTEFWPHDSQYVPSPDGVWVAVMGAGSGTDFALRIIPVQGGPAIFSGTLGYNPAWSVDSRYLAFAQRNASSYSLVVFDPGAYNILTVLRGDDPGVPVLAIPAGAAAGAGAISLFPAWSPAGQKLAVAVLASEGQESMGWAGLVSLNGAPLKVLPPVEPRMVPYSLAYSADGLFLSVSFFDSSSGQGVGVYSAAGRLLRWLPGAQAGPWSPAGHTLALTDLAGVSLLAEPDVPDAKPQSVGPARCSGLVWKP